MTEQETERLTNKMIELMVRSIKNDAELSKLSNKHSARILTLASACACATFIAEIVEIEENNK